MPGNLVDEATPGIGAFAHRLRQTRRAAPKPAARDMPQPISRDLAQPIRRLADAGAGSASDDRGDVRCDRVLA
jgi:hypothetical protein